MTRPQRLVAWAGDDQGSALEVTASGAAADAVARHGPGLVSDGVAGGITVRETTLWDPAAVPEAVARLGWVDLPESSLSLVTEVEQLRSELAEEGLDRVVLCGMGGSSLAAEVIARSAGVELTVLDSSHPDRVRDVLGTQLTRTVAVVSSKSGSTLETDCQRRAFEETFAVAGIDVASRMVAVTDPGSPLERIAVDTGYRAVFPTDPQVGDRFSALSAFGVVPAGLAGADVEGLLEAAVVVTDLLADNGNGNPGLVLGAALGGTDPLRRTVVLADAGSGMVGFSSWVEQLLAESTGKQGQGLLPVVVGGPNVPQRRQDTVDALVVRLMPTLNGEDGEVPTAEPDEVEPDEVTVAGPLGAQFLLWEYAVVVAARLLGVNPFDQPDVDDTTRATRQLLEARRQPGTGRDLDPPVLIDGAIELRAGPSGLLDGVTDLAGGLRALLARVPGDGYLAVTAYLDRRRDALTATALRLALATRMQRPVTFGWGPRSLHSTGQLHKGGPAVGAYLQITAEPEAELPVPGLPFAFGHLIAAQAAGEAHVLTARGRPVLRLHLTDRAAGWAQLLATMGVPQ